MPRGAMVAKFCKKTSLSFNLTNNPWFLAFRTLELKPRLPCDPQPHLSELPWRTPPFWTDGFPDQRPARDHPPGLVHARRCLALPCHEWPQNSEQIAGGARQSSSGTAAMANSGAALWWWNRAIGGGEMEREGMGCCARVESKSEGRCCSNFAPTRARRRRSGDHGREWRLLKLP
jgi:hypothetical protein